MANLINTLKAMYSSSKACVKSNNEYSSFIISNMGVKQVDPASSMLCLFYLHDILNSINIESDYIINLDPTKLIMLLFEDDAVILYRFSSVIYEDYFYYILTLYTFWCS